MSAPSWREALDDWAAFLDSLESALDRGDWEPFAGGQPWHAPGNMTAAPTQDEQHRALALADRAGRLRERLDSALRETASELSGERRKTHAAVSYLRADSGQ